MLLPPRRIGSYNSHPHALYQYGFARRRRSPRCDCRCYAYCWLGSFFLLPYYRLPHRSRTEVDKRLLGEHMLHCWVLDIIPDHAVSVQEE